MIARALSQTTTQKLLSTSIFESLLIKYKYNCFNKYNLVKKSIIVKIKKNKFFKY